MIDRYYLLHHLGVAAEPIDRVDVEPARADVLRRREEPLRLLLVDEDARQQRSPERTPAGEPKRRRHDSCYQLLPSLFWTTPSLGYRMLSMVSDS